MRATILLTALPLLLAGCAGLDRDDQGVLQPQTVRGPCEVKKFFLLGTQTVHSRITVRNTGEACSMTILNRDLQAVVNAAFVTTAPAHGTGTAGLVFAGRQASISYTPQPGYTGPDELVVTLEPNAHGIAFAITVAPPG